MLAKKLNKSWGQIFFFVYICEISFAWFWKISREVGPSGLKPRDAKVNRGKMVSLSVYQQKIKLMYNLYTHIKSAQICWNSFKIMAFKNENEGFPTVAQLVMNPTAAAQVSMEAWIPSSAQCSRLKDLALLQLWHSLQLWLGFSPWPRNVHTPQVQPFKKKKNIISA